MQSLKQLCSAHTKALKTGDTNEATLRQKLLDFQPKNNRDKQTKLAYFAALCLHQGGDLNPIELQQVIGKPV